MSSFTNSISKRPDTSYYQKRKRKKEAIERNHIEAKFGQGKNGYNLNKISARLKETSENWIACIFFVMNLIHYEHVSLFCSFFRAVEKLILPIFSKPYIEAPLPDGPGRLGLETFLMR